MAGILNRLFLVGFACASASTGACAFGCASGSAVEDRLAKVAQLPAPPLAADMMGSFLVPYPPPPATVEVVPAPPSDPDCVWLDGQWSFKNQEYQWIPGAWVKRLAGCTFAKSRFWWDDALGGPARLRYRIGRWVIPSPPFTECPPPSACQ